VVIEVNTRRIPHQWTEEEKAVLRAEYTGTYHSASLIAAKLGVSPGAVRAMVQNLGITKQRSRPWSSKELQDLERMVHKYSAATIARRLHRSLTAVQTKITKLKLKGQQRDDWYTAIEAARILGVNHYKVERWIQAGELKATRHNGVCKQGSPWHIWEKDLKKFIVTHADELTGRNVDLQQIVFLLVPEMELYRLTRGEV